MHPAASPPESRTKRPVFSQKSLAIILIALGILAAALLLARLQNYYHANWNDFFVFWLAPRLVLQGEHPYDPNAWAEGHRVFQAQSMVDHTFLYPLPLALLLAPLGLLSLQQTAVVWIALTLAGILSPLLVWYSTAPKKWPAGYLIPILAGMVFFRPVIVTEVLGQVDGLMLICLSLALSLWIKGKWFWGGALAAVLLLKPQLGIPILLLVNIWLLLRRNWRALLGEAACGLGLLALGMLYDPSWLSRWLTIGQGKLSASMQITPNVWGASAWVCGSSLHCTYLAGGVLCLFIAGITIWLLSRRWLTDPRQALGLCLPAALMISPFLWAYSQIFLVYSLLLVADLMYKRGWPYLLTASFPILAALFSWLVFLVSIQLGRDTLSAVVPLALWALLLPLLLSQPHQSPLPTEM